MQKNLVLFGLLIVSGGCSCMNNTERGMVGGGLIGGALGTVVGAAVGRPGAGALIGAGVGTAVGGVEGSAQDHRERRADARLAAAANAQAARQMTLGEVVNMSQTNVPEQLIINQIHTTGSVFNLRSEDITYLRDQGVSSRVIAEMQNHSARTVVVQPRPVVVYEGYPPPPIGVSAGVIYRR